jgi:hypothetical protein
VTGRRDEFSSGTKNKLGQQVGWHCSRPGCPARTVSADAKGEGEIMLGRAAHITAAAPLGPRYNARLTTEERKNKNNGIWLCVPCSNLIDEDESAYPESLLREWKRKAQKKARFELMLTLQPAAAEIQFGADEVTEALEPVTAAAQVRLDTLRRISAWPVHPIPLELRLVDGEESHSFTPETFAAVLETYDDAALIAAPGSGKTTTMVQIATAITSRGTSVAAVILLAEWATGTEPFLRSLTQQAGFRDVSLTHIELLARSGRFILLLDGWNELDDAGRKRVRVQINELKREFPDIQFVVSSRHHEHDSPVQDPAITLGTLDRRQQQEIAAALRGPDGQALLDHAWRTSGLRELIEVPLYLSVFLDRTPGARLPTTKDELLAEFASKHENNLEHAQTIRTELHELHQQFLAALARRAIELQTTALSADIARTTIVETQRHLMESGQQIAAIAAPHVIDILARTHLIVRHAGGSVGFHHHQFQEWYASQWVEQQLVASLNGNPENIRILREDILDLPDWEESVLFACERLSRRDVEGARAVAAGVIQTLGIDPVFGGEMIFRSSEAVWEIVRDEIVRFARQWHGIAPYGRSIDFMVATGKSEFSDDLWPLIATEDDQQNAFEVFRAGPRFRPSVLGQGLQDRLKLLPERTRARIGSEIAHNSAMDGLELATQLAIADDSSMVKYEVVDALAFRGATRMVVELLRDAPQAVWEHVACKWDLDDFDDEDLKARLVTERHRLDQLDFNPSALLYRLNREGGDENAEQRVEELIAQMQFGGANDQGRDIVYETSRKYPEAVSRGLLGHLERGEEIPYGTAELLRDSQIVIDEGPIAERVLAATAGEFVAGIAVAGPRVVGSLVDGLLHIDRTLAEVRRNNTPRDPAMPDEHIRLSRLISSSRVKSLILAVLERSAITDPDGIGSLSDILLRHGRGVDTSPLQLPEAERQQLQDVLINWSKALLADPAATRYQMAELTQAMTRVPSDRILDALAALLAEDLRRLTAENEAAASARAARRPPPQNARMHWNSQYAKALIAIGSERAVNVATFYLEHPIFGVDAAHVLAAIAIGPEPKDENTPFRSGPDFDAAHDNFIKRRDGAFRETHPFVDLVLTAARNVVASGGEKAVERGLQLAAVALRMPYSNKQAEIDWFLALDARAILKQRLLMSMVLAGERVPLELLGTGLDQLLADAVENPWLNDEREGWRYAEWLRLVPFSDRPDAVFEMLDRISDRVLSSDHIHGLLNALGCSPSEQADTILTEFARRDSDMLYNYMWLSAVSKRGSENIGLQLLNLLDIAAGIDDRGHRMELYKELAASSRKHDRVREAIHTRYEREPPGRARIILERAIADDHTEAGVLLLLRVSAAEGRPMRNTALAEALNNVLVDKRPSLSFHGMQEMYALPAGRLRKMLFDLLLSGSPAEIDLAAACLDEIDEIRDRYGATDSDRRHPHIQTGMPWPKLPLET